MRPILAIKILVLPLLLCSFSHLAMAQEMLPGEVPAELTEEPGEEVDVSGAAAAGANELKKKTEAETSKAAAPRSSRVTDMMVPFPVENALELRDPFSIPTTDKPVAPGSVHGPVMALQKFPLSAMKVTGIIWDVSRPKAMVLDPNGSTHIVGLNAKIGNNNGYVAVIREGEIVVVETTDDQGRLISSATTVKIESLTQQPKK